VLRAPAAWEDRGVRRLRERRPQPVAPFARRRTRRESADPRVVRSVLEGKDRWLALRLHWPHSVRLRELVQRRQIGSEHLPESRELRIDQIGQLLEDRLLLIRRRVVALRYVALQRR